MLFQKRISPTHQLVLLVVMLLTVLACRTSELVQRYVATPEARDQSDAVSAPLEVWSFTPTQLPIATIRKSATTPSTRAPVLVQTLPSLTPTRVLPPQSMPTDAPTLVAPTLVPPTLTQTRSPTLVSTRSPVARAPVSAPTRALAPPKVVPTPTPSFEYHVKSSWCGPNWQTFVEGTVSQNQSAKSGLLVRIAINPDGTPVWDDYKTGTDPTKPGGYTQIIDANAPHGGLWYLWVVDPQTKQRISDIATVKTDPQRVEETSCQSATVDFGN